MEEQSGNPKRRNSMEIIFDNVEQASKRSERPLLSPAQNEDAPITLSSEQIAEGWRRLAANNLEAIRSAASAIGNS